MITGSDSGCEAQESAKTPAASAPATDTKGGCDDPKTSPKSSKVEPTTSGSSRKNLTLAEGRARARAAKEAASSRAVQEAVAAKKRAASSSPRQDSTESKGYRNLFDSSSDSEEEGAVHEPREITNDLDEQQEQFCAVQAQASAEVAPLAPCTPSYPRGYYPPDVDSGSPLFLERLQAPRGLIHGRTSRGAYERALVQKEPLFIEDIEAARCVLLAAHRIPLKEFTSLRKKPEDRGGLFPVWGYPWVQPENTTTPTQAENLFWSWVSLHEYSAQELNELREDRMLSHVLDQRDLRIEFAHLIGKRQLHSSMERLKQAARSGAHDERGYGKYSSAMPRKSAKKPRTTYEAAVASGPRLQQPSGSLPGAGLPAPTSSVMAGIPATSQAAGASQSAGAPGRSVPHGSGTHRSGPGEQAELSHAYEYEAPQPQSPRTSALGRDSGESYLQEELRQLRNRVYAIEIALGVGPGGQAASQAGKPGTLESLRHDVDGLGRETRELHGRVDRRAPASAMKDLRRDLDYLSQEVRGRGSSREAQGYGYHPSYAYGSYGGPSHGAPAYSAYEPRGYQSAFPMPASATSVPVASGVPPRFEEVSSTPHGRPLPPAEEKGPADRDTA